MVLHHALNAPPLHDVFGHKHTSFIDFIKGRYSALVVRFQSNLKCTSLIHYLETIRWSSPTFSEVIGHYHINFIYFQYRKAFCLLDRISSKPQIHKSHLNASCTQFLLAAYLEISS